MVDLIATLHCKVLAMHQEAKERERYQALQQGTPYGDHYQLVIERAVVAELDRVLRLFKLEEKEDAREHA